MSTDYLQTPLQYLKGVGPRRAADLERVGLSTIEDLLHRFPLRYEDRGHLQPIATLKAGQHVSIAGRIQSSRLRTTRRPGFKIFEALIGDATGSVVALWMNQSFLQDILRRDAQVVLFGPVEARPGLQLMNPDYEIIDAGDSGSGEAEDALTVHTGRIVPVYEKAGSMTPKMQRRLVHEVLSRMPDDLPDPFPESIRQRLRLPDRRTALMDSHFPPSGTPHDELNEFRTPAQMRLIFEEFFLFQLGLTLRKRATVREAKPRIVKVDDRIRESARAILPFRLTEGQKSALKEIVEDMQRPTPMNRLLQGDVGAGKTIVALLAALVAMENGLQVAFMAPTEILAEQHFLSLRKLLEKSRFRIELLTGGTSGLRRRNLLARLSAGDIHMLVGTHALVQGTVNFQSLGLAIIDEQHRFGVVQRATLRAKGLMPDVLVMTATPIPRTLALTVYGDLDVSVIPDMPPGRRAILTTVKPESRRDDIYESVLYPARGGSAGVRCLPAGRGIGESRSESRHRNGGPPATGGVSGIPGRAPPWSLEAGRERSRDARICRGGHSRVGFDDGHRSRHRRSECYGDGHRTCGEIRLIAASSAARACGTRRPPVLLHPPVPISDLGAGSRAAEGIG